MINTIYNLIFKNKKKFSHIEYWEKRARQYGKRSVINIGHSEGEVSAITKMQKDTIFPYLSKLLTGREKLILDFGCGPGRFTCDLALMIQGKAIGVDPIGYLIELASQNEDIEYRLMKESNIPVNDASVDVVWICLVLGGVTDDDLLRSTISEIKRVSKKDGLIFLVENTSEKKSSDYWKFRSVETYQTFFDFIELNHISDYFDLGERISIMSGRKYV